MKEVFLLKDDHLDQINDEDSEIEEEIEKDKIKKFENHKTDRYSIPKKRVERSKRLSLYMQLEEKKDVETNNANKLLSTYEDKTENNDKIIKSDLKTQMDTLKQKLEKRSNF